ncbi:hypothetical protein E5288_WYG013133 [Bos mutus]|uniref:Uncharacterized protein n=1 Tax=Bos mutus TaxID=72004 RepID=A0A6B0R9R4_9CETA|nr:hypothetical protein [Bos mutus]
MRPSTEPSVRTRIHELTEREKTSNLRQAQNNEQTGFPGNSARNAHAVIIASVCCPFTRDSPPRPNVAAATSPEGHILSLKPRGIKVCFSLGHPTKVPINRDEKC